LEPKGRAPGELAREEKPYEGEELWDGDDGRTRTSWPPPEGFDGEEDGKWGDEDYSRTLSAEELRAVDADTKRINAFRLAQGRAERDDYFRFKGDPDLSSKQAEPSKPSEPFIHPLQRLYEGEAGFARRRGDAEEPAQPILSEAAVAGEGEGAPRRPAPEPRPLRASASPREPIPAPLLEGTPVDVYVKQRLSQPEASAAESPMSPITTHRHGDVLVVTSNNPPVNALGHAVREGLVSGGRIGVIVSGGNVDAARFAALLDSDSA